MPTWFEGMPFGIAVAALLLIVLLRAQATYWIGRGVIAGALHTRFADPPQRSPDHQGDRAVEPVRRHRWSPFRS